MTKKIPLALWFLVIGAVTLLYFIRSHSPGIIFETTETELDNIPWNQLPMVESFELVAQNGQPLGSSELKGQPYLISFFFSSCPTICKQLNKQIQQLDEQLRNENVRFVSVTVDPENDTPEVLSRYARDFRATVDRWVFLTDKREEIAKLGEGVLQVVIDRGTHTDDIFLIDQWGRYRDRFRWNEPDDMKRLLSVVKQVVAEEVPPGDQLITTRNLAKTPSAHQ